MSITPPSPPVKEHCTTSTRKVPEKKTAPSIGYNTLITAVESLLKKKPHVVIAISGFGGSGKSYLAERLNTYFGGKDSQIVLIDHLYGPNPDGPGIFDQSNWPLLTKILEDVLAGKKLRYEGKGCKGEAIFCDEELPKVIIVEGVRLLQPKLMPYFDVSIWIACPQELALQRAKARDRSQGEDEQTVALWDSDWGPKDRLYFETYHPDTIASFLYKEYQ